MRLLEFYSLIEPMRGDGPLTREVNGLAWDCRRVVAGNLFVAIPGPGRDTQAAVDMAVERGAAAVLCEGREVTGARVTRIQVANVRAALPRVAELFFGQPDRRMKIVGVAGSFGTAAPAALLKLILDAAGFKAGVIGSTGCELGERRLPPPRKNCELLDYHELLAQAARAGCGACVMEITPEAVEQRRFAEIAFDTVVFGTFNPEGRGAALVQFCRGLSAGPKRMTAAFDIDDPIGSALFESGACSQQISYGFNGAANVHGTELELGHGSLGMLAKAGTQEIRLRTGLTGRQNATNLLAACAGALALRIPLALTRITLQKAAPPSGALEPADPGGEFPVYIDEARTKAEVQRTLESLREITTGRVLAGIASMGGESVEQRIQLGRAAAENADYTVITTNNPRREPAWEIANQVARGFFGGVHKQHHIELDRAQAIQDLIAMARPGDAVVITGKGRESHQEFADTIVPFDDHEEARAALESRRCAGLAGPMPRHSECVEEAVLASEG